ncbi:MAG TPA: penicillin-binding protein 2 [Solirubrobacterales bacterium]|jgi:penicillin-binding protein 2|nr:penicillin-binding protein 2 [Solirubrobacterales bacterium]
MYLRNDDRPQGSRLSLRVAVLGGVAVALFGVLFFRLWNLQVLDGDKYLAEAKNNRTREFKVIAPRGNILDRDGNVIVDNRTSLALQLNTSKLPEDQVEEREELERLGQLAHMSLPKVRKAIHEGEEVAAGAPVTLRQDVGFYLIAYIEEHQREFPGVTVQRVFVRHYPHSTFAAHVLGSVGEINEEELKEPDYKGLEPGDEIGKGGVEYTYDKFLRGQPGLQKVQVNALGQPTPGGQLVSKPPTPGESLKLTLDPEVQAAGESALASQGLPGAFITMDVHDGQVLGLGSFPTFEPADLIPPMSQAEVDALIRNETTAPLSNRATEGLYPTGSTFKIITALAAVENGVITPNSVINDPGQLCVGTDCFHNAEGAAYGPLTLVPALEVSDDVFFYTLGLDMWETNELQKWAHDLGIGRPSGIDIPVNTDGLLPSKKWRDALFAEGETERPWSAGDNIQLATGQGDLQSNPLQMAIAYAALGNGGTIVTPHLGMEVEDAAGRVLKEFDPKPQRKVKIDAGTRSVIMEGLHQAAQGPGGTSEPIFGSFPIPVAGKTGTAERPGHADQSWYCVLAPYPNPRIVTCVTIEEGGFGAQAAAPAAHTILEAYFHDQIEAASRAEGEEESGETEIE